MTRPVGEISLALLQAVERLGPAPVRVLAERAQVGYDAARYTATRLVDRGVLARLSDERPAVLGLPQHATQREPADRGCSFWEVPLLCRVDRGAFECL